MDLIKYLAIDMITTMFCLAFYRIISDKDIKTLNRREGYHLLSVLN